MHPAEEPVVSPSGHIYSREFILEYLLTKSQELKKQQKIFEDQQVCLPTTNIIT
jgi:nitric oxide synthase-interacting protein